MHHELIALAMKHGACPYEWLLMLGEHSNVVIADYYQFMIPFIRSNILGKMNKRVEDCIVIIDEAHNLSRRIREYLSSSVSYPLLRRVEKEMRLLEGLSEIKEIEARKKRVAEACLKRLKR